MATQLSLNHIDIKQDASLNDFQSSGFVPILSAVNELIVGRVRELYFFGDSGSGKSHLLSAIHRRYIKTGNTAIFISMTEFLKSDTQALFGLEMLNLVMIDDIHLAYGLSNWQEALFHLINRGRQVGTQFIFTAKMAQGELGFSLPDLTTRLSQILSFELPNGMNIEDRRALLASLLRQKGWQLPDSITECLITEGPHHIGDMLQVLTAIIPHFNHRRGKLSTKQLEAIKQIIKQQSLLIELTDIEPDNFETISQNFSLPMTYH